MESIAQMNLVAVAVLVLILSGNVTLKDLDAYGTVKERDVNRLAAVMELENKDNGDMCLLLTGSVPLNRMKYGKTFGGTTLEKVIEAKLGSYWQYAYKTRSKYKDYKASDHTKLLAKYLLIFGPVCPENVVYQGQRKNGSGVYTRIKVKGQKDEIFCYE